MKAVIFLSIVLIAAVLVINAEQEEFKCKAGVHYQENKCNGCFCGTHGLGCTLMACLNQDPKLFNCEKGTTWKEGCEQCWCTNLGTVCTTDCQKVHEQPQH